MKLGMIDLADFEYLIIYSEPEDPEHICTWTLPEGSFQINYQKMVKRGVKIRNVYRRIPTADLPKVKPERKQP